VYAGILGVVLCVAGSSLLAQEGAKPAPIPPEQIRATMEKYVSLLNEGDAASIMALYGDNPTVEDPVGSKPIAGRDAILNFYQRASPLLKGRVKLAGRVIVSGVDGAMPMVADLGSPTNRILDVINAMKFDTNGKIISMRAYVSPR
jgi:steroid delta-isomerase